MARVLLTGATGFVGGAVLARLRALGQEVLTLGRRAPEGAAPGAHLLADLGDGASVLRHREALSGVEVVAHVGARMLRSADPAADDPVEAMRVNVLGTAHLLAALPSSLAGFCYVSSVDVYGSPLSLPVGEDQPPQPATYYAASKLAGESLLDVWSRRSGAPVAVLRLSHVYGPGDTSAKAIPNFLRSALSGRRITVRGDGSDRRDFLYVEDAAEAVAGALARRPAGTFNVASGTGTSIRELLAAVLAVTGATAEPEWLPATRPPTSLVLDVSRVREALGWEPRVTLPEGLRRTAAALAAGS